MSKATWQDVKGAMVLAGAYEEAVKMMGDMNFLQVMGGWVVDECWVVGAGYVLVGAGVVDAGLVGAGDGWGWFGGCWRLGGRRRYVHECLVGAGATPTSGCLVGAGCLGAAGLQARQRLPLRDCSCI